MYIDPQLPSPPPPGQPELPEPIFAKLVAPNISGVVFTDQLGNTLPVYSDLHAFERPITEGTSPASHEPLSPIVSDLLPVTVVKVEISWSANRDDGTPAEFLVKPNLSAPRDANTQVADVVFLFKPHVVELTRDNLRTAPLQRRQIHIKVRLSVDNILTTGWIDDLPFVEVLIPSLQIPTVLALYQGINLQQSVLILVPSSSPFESVAGLRFFLERLNSIVYTLKEIGSFASFLLGLDSLVNALPSVGGSNYVVTDDILLDDISFEPGATWEDRVSSILFIGPQGKWVHCQNKSHNDEEGSFIITIGEEYHVIVPTLRANPLHPVDRIFINHQPTDDDPGEHSYLFDDTLSTIIFSPPIPARPYVDIVGPRSIRLDHPHGVIQEYRINYENLEDPISIAWSSNGSVINPASKITNISFFNTGTWLVQVDVTDINRVHVQNHIDVIVEVAPLGCLRIPPICCTHPSSPVCGPRMKP
ncbi:hypothetical protein [Paenibacillus tyrfis]|uniref:hypothetical protein n=1 Tax=Paenibacillus tyrfis TaxID=1501230 RepID=UPI00209D99A9|nr:hypothetical protein [Paenibacillus tyrfis]MCP1311770.1 hypothetical protein [Paenibacillus tyrfis]